MAMDFFSKLGNKISDTTKDVTQKAKKCYGDKQIKGSDFSRRKSH